MAVCSCCSTTVEDHRTVNCCVCGKVFNISCVDVSAAEARKIHANSGLTWSCEGCSRLGSDLNGLKKAIVSLQEEIKILKNKLDIAPPQSSLSAIDMERVIGEISDRERRKCNVIVFGCKETAAESNREQNQYDQQMVKEILSTLGVRDVEPKSIRLGKYDVTKVDSCRPIKVTLPSELTVFTILRSANALKSSTKFAGLFISRDKTPFQLKMHNDARQELKRRRDNGESNLKIKYSNGIPGIVSSLN